MNSSSSNSSNSWLSWFNSRESASAINKKNLEKLFSTFNYEISKSDCIEMLINHNETVFLNKTNFGSKNVSIFHHLVSVGGTIYDTEGKKFGLIQGVGKLTATKMTPDMDSLCNVESEDEVNVPTMSNILAVRSKDQVDSLVVSTRSKLRPRNFIPIPPFLLSTVNETIGMTNGDAAEVLVAAVKGITRFDEENKNDIDYVDKAKEKCSDLVRWLYLVSQNSTAIAATSSIGCSCEKVAEALEDVEENSLAPERKTPESSSLFDQVEKSLKRPFEVLAASSSSTSDFMEKLTQLQSQSNKKSSKSFRKIPTKYQNMILVASSVGEVTTLEYDAEGAEFFKSSSVLNGQVMLNSLMEAENIDCSISSAVTSTLMFGSFLWKDSVSPSGFASAVLSSENFIRSDTLHEGMILDYATKFDMSETSLTKLTKTQVRFPEDVEELTHRLRGFHKLATFFFKKNGYLSQGLKKLVNFCLDNRTMLRTRIYMDEKFLEKLICAIDERVYHWLKQCSTQNSVTETDISLIEFSSLISDVQLNRFNYILPPSVTRVCSIEKEEKKESEKTSKKSKLASMVKNNKLFEEWKLRRSEN